MLPLPCRKVLFAVAFLFFCGSSLAQRPDASQSMRLAEPAQDELEDGDNRRLFGFWNILFLRTSISLSRSRYCLSSHIVSTVSPDDHPCPPFGKPHDDCVAARSAKSSSSSSHSSSSSSSSSSSYTDSSSSVSNTSQETAGVGTYIKGNTFSALMIAAAALAVALAIAAVILGQRKKPKEMHPLTGSVGRRMGLFSNFADSALCNNTERPQRVVEMTMSGDDYKSVV